MIDRGADDGQAERHVDDLAEAGRFDRRQSLIVIHREHGIESVQRFCVNAVSAGRGPVTSMPSLRSSARHGAMIRVSSVPSVPSSPACGFRPSTRMRRLGDTEAGAEIVVQDARNAADALGRDRVRNFA